MSKDTLTDNTDRRKFLIGMAAAGGATTAAAIAGGALAGTESDAAPDKPATAKQGYRETPHIREYYRLAQF
ncbi:MAG: transcriptional initiation protein Tat [Gammaproteobacteria bacterium]|nr:transcriptional initiation protein Tat [Gammaproteobacteria bacterium]MDH3466159.1 transcriptional initiation protein Tat [Gammaproteobacteria bacterium]